MSLRADCVRTLTDWAAPTQLQEALRGTFLEHLAEHDNGWSRDCAGAHLTASALVCSPNADQILLVAHKKLGRWLQVGGHIEPGDRTLADAAWREASEEAGLSSLRTSPVPGPVQLDRHEVPCGPVRPCYHLDVRYVFVADPEETPAPAAEESPDVRWFTHDALPDVDDSVRTLIAAARSALRAG